MTHPDELVLAISSNDSILHVGTAQAVRDHLLAKRSSSPGPPPPPPPPGPPPPEGADPVELAGPPSRPRFEPHLMRLSEASLTPLPSGLQLFDARGQRLTLTGLGAAASFRAVLPPDVVSEEVLLARIAAALDHLDELLVQQPELGVDPPRRHVQVPRPQGCTLPDVLAELDRSFFPLDPNIASNRGNWLHNLAHAAGLI